MSDRIALDPAQYICQHFILGTDLKVKGVMECFSCKENVLKI